MRVVVATAAAVLMASAPAAYADKTVTAFNTGWAGWIFSQWTPADTDAPDPPVRMASQCEFVAVPTPAGVRVVFGGTATVVPMAPQPLPVTTTVECEVNNFAAGGSNVQTASATTAGASAAAAGSSPEWPNLAVTLCLRSSTVLTPPTQVLAHARVCYPASPEDEDKVPPAFSGDLCSYTGGGYHAVVDGTAHDSTGSNPSGVVEWELGASWDGATWTVVDGEMFAPQPARTIYRSTDITTLVASHGEPPPLYRIRVRDAAGNESYTVQSNHPCPPQPG